MIKLKELRQLKGLKQNELAIELNIPKSTYNYWENGKIEIDFKNLFKLADYFNVSIDYLLGHDYITKLASLTDDENELIEKYRKCNEKNKALIIGYVNGITDKE